MNNEALTNSIIEQQIAEVRSQLELLEAQLRSLVALKEQRRKIELEERIDNAIVDCSLSEMRDLARYLDECIDNYGDDRDTW